MSDKGQSRVQDTSEARSDSVTKHGRVKNMHVIKKRCTYHKLVKMVPLTGVMETQVEGMEQFTPPGG